MRETADNTRHPTCDTRWVGTDVEGHAAGSSLSGDDSRTLRECRGKGNPGGGPTTAASAQPSSPSSDWIPSTDCARATAAASPSFMPVNPIKAGDAARRAGQSAGSATVLAGYGAYESGSNNLAAVRVLCPSVGGIQPERNQSNTFQFLGRGAVARGTP